MASSRERYVLVAEPSIIKTICDSLLAYYNTLVKKEYHNFSAEILQLHNNILFAPKVNGKSIFVIPDVKVRNGISNNIRAQYEQAVINNDLEAQAEFAKAFYKMLDVPTEREYHRQRKIDAREDHER